MNKKIKKIFGFAMAFVIAGSCFNGLATSARVQAVEANSKASVSKYEIYPNPQSVSYSNGSFKMSNEVNVVFENTIDEVTKNRVNEVLASNNFTVSISDKIVNGKTNILVGTNNSKGYVDSYVKENLNIATENLFDNIDAYSLNLKDNVVSILGKDTDAAFYGATTLKHILNQADGEILNVSVEDYADTNLRGFIEGYYGIPWSTEDRASLMKFGGEYKMNTYIFAPKDDPYHNQRWRDLYPEEELQKLAELVKVGKETKTQFTWSIHPFMNNKINEAGAPVDSSKPELGVIPEEAYQKDLEIIKAKFDQLYSIGVRQFGVAADDIQGRFNPAFHSRVMEDLLAWGNEKDEHVELIFVPTVYTGMYMGWGAKYVREIGRLMPKEVHIMWTGESVLGRVTQETVDNFIKYTSTPEEGVEGRNPFFWLNWPVNDINNKRLILSPATVIDSGVKNLDGIVTNPMQQAEASKISLFSIADFAWNVDAFDYNKTYEDGFKYIEPDATEYFHEIAKHLCDPADAGQVLPESEEFVGLFEEYNRLVDENKSTKDIAKVLIPKYETIINAVDKFKELSKNENLKKEVEPWINSLRDIASASIEFLNLSNQLEDKDENNLWENYISAKALEQNSRTHIVQNLGGPTIVEAGGKRLVPFMNTLMNNVSTQVYDILQSKEDNGETIFDRNKQELTYLVQNPISFETVIGDMKQEGEAFNNIKTAYNNYMNEVNKYTDYLIEDVAVDKINEAVESIKEMQKELVALIVGEDAEVVEHQLVKDYVAKFEKLEGYTVRSLNEVNYAINDLKSFQALIDGNEGLKKELVDRIEEQISNLVVKANNEELQSKLDEVKELDSTKYTEETWNNVLDAIEKVENLMANDYNATKVNEEEVVKNLELAVSLLVEKPVEDNKPTPEDPSKPGDDTDVTPEDKDEAEKDETTVDKENSNSDSTKTSDSFTGSIFVILALAAIGVVVSRKKLRA